MNTAYLILAHDQPRHLARLIRALRTPRVRYFVHIDRKADVSPFTSALAGIANVTLLGDAERVSVHWGGYSMVKATLNLLAAATATG